MTDLFVNFYPAINGLTMILICCVVGPVLYWLSRYM